MLRALKVSGLNRVMRGWPKGADQTSKHAKAVSLECQIRHWPREGTRNPRPQPEGMMERDHLAGRPFCHRMPVWKCHGDAQPQPMPVALAKCRLSRTDVLTYRVRLEFGIRYVHFDQVSERDDSN